MKIAVPFEDGQVFQHFGRSAQFKFYEAENGQLLRTEVIPTNGQGGCEKDGEKLDDMLKFHKWCGSATAHSSPHSSFLRTSWSEAHSQV